MWYIMDDQGRDLALNADNIYHQPFEDDSVVCKRENKAF